MNPNGFRGEGARWLPVRQPEHYAGEVFQALGRDKGIAVKAPEQGTAPAGAETLAVHQGRELVAVLHEMLRHSTNITAELVGFAASRAGVADISSPLGSAAAMNAWAAQVAGFPLGDEGFRMANHSGLSTESRVSPRRLVELLTAVARRMPAGESARGLPEGIAALLKDYNVATRNVDLDYKNLDIAAKTGTMDYVRGLAGYIVTPSGRRLAFAIFSNDIDRRPDGEIQRIDKRWMARAREFERGLIRSWVKRLES
jgi:D-alanyl-D-alanine carboxypeptidase/D-alanyl-D-alanine-endopeptidase (penicillin-binding protein 4)